MYDGCVNLEYYPGSVLRDADVKLECAAIHEAGHLVVAAVQGLRLRPEGLGIDPSAAGLACYCKDPGESDLSRERVIVATYAGFKAEERFRQDRRYPFPKQEGIVIRGDWVEALEVIGKLSYFSNDRAPTIQRELEDRSEQFVAQNWAAIQALAAAVLTKDWVPLIPLKSGGEWAKKDTAKYVAGDEIVKILAQFGIVAVCNSDC